MVESDDGNRIDRAKTLSRQENAEEEPFAILRLMAASLLLVCLVSAAELEVPVAAVLSSSEHGATVKRAGQDTILTLHAGMVLFAGDEVTQRSGKSDIAFCPTQQALEITGGAGVRFGRSAVEKLAGTFRTSSVSTCLLPQLDRNPVPRNMGRPKQSLARVEPLPLLEAIRSAVEAERAGQFESAVAFYRDIRERWPEADWTRQAIARIVEQTAITEKNAEGGTYAFVVGISKYQSPHVRRLEYADDDAQLFADFLGSPRGGGLRLNQNLWRLENEEATRDRVIDELNSFLAGKASRDNTLIIYIAAHGAYICRNSPCKPGSKDEEPYILTHDSDPEDPEVSAIRMADLHELITAQADRFGTVLLYLDVCHSGNMGALPIQTRLTSGPVEEVFGNARGDFGLVLASSKLKPKERKNEYAMEDNRFGGGHGIFTYFVVRGLNGEAQADGNVVLMQDLMDHVRENVRRQTGNRQSPVQKSSRPDLPVVRDASQPGIEIPKLETGTQVVLRVREGRESSRRSTSVADRGFRASEGSQRAKDENEGQQVLLRYLQGEQSPPSREDFERCAAAFGRVMSEAPDAAFTESRMLFCSGRALIFRKRFAEAQVLLERSIRIDPGRGYAYNALGIAYLEQVISDAANIERARHAFEDAASRAPYWAYPLHNLALTEEQAGRYQEAIANYRRAQQLAPYASYPSYNLGLLLQRLNRYAEAKQELEAAVDAALVPRKIDRKAPSLWLHLAEGYNALGSLSASEGLFAAARTYFEKALDEEPRNATARHNLALLESRKGGDAGRAEQLWREVIRDEGDSNLAAASRMALAEWYGSRAKLDEAVTEYRALLALHPKFTAARRSLALILVEQGRTAEALAEVDRALNNAPPANLRALRNDIERIRDGRDPQDERLKRIHRARKRVP